VAKLEYFYSAHSAFAYLGSARLMQIAGAAGAPIVHKPVDLDRVVGAVGSTAFAQRPPAHRAYYFGREIERWAEQRGVEIMRGLPTHHRKDMTLPNGMLIAGIRQGRNVDRLAHAMLEAHWRDDADIADRETLAGLARSVGGARRQHQRSHRPVGVRLADLFRRRRHVLRPGPSGDGRARAAPALQRRLAAADPLTATFHRTAPHLPFSPKKKGRSGEPRTALR
jgi:2-hydroxychromene-2-carboxylate isomerase